MIEEAPLCGIGFSENLGGAVSATAKQQFQARSFTVVEQAESRFEIVD